MLFVASNLLGQGGRDVRLVGTFDGWHMLCIQVQGPSVIFLSVNAQDLYQDGPNGQSQGLQINSAMSNGIVQIWWKGQLWVTASAPNTLYEFQAIPSSPGIGP